MNKSYHAKQGISKEKIYVIGFAFLIIFIGLLFYNSKDLTAESDTEKEILMAEFNSIQPLPDAIRSDLSSHNKPSSAIVDAKYRSNKSYDKIRSFYIKEATQKGWIFLKEETVRQWGQDLGGKTIEFRKGKYTLSITYTGEKAGYGWDFAVDLVWRPYTLHKEK